MQGNNTLTLTAYNGYTGGATVNSGTLALPAKGYQYGIIVGSLTINSSGTVNADVGWSLGWGPNAAPSLSNSAYCVSAIAINGGVLNFTTTGSDDSGGTSASTITMTGGTISGATPDLYGGIINTPTLTTNASTATAVISSGFNLRLGGGTLTFNVAQGNTGGADLLVSGPIVQGSNYPGYQSDGIVKTGSGLLSLTGTNTYRGGTTVSGGVLQAGSTASLPYYNYPGNVTVNSARRCSFPPAAPDGLRGHRDPRYQRLPDRFDSRSRYDRRQHDGCRR